MNTLLQKRRFYSFLSFWWMSFFVLSSVVTANPLSPPTVSAGGAILMDAQTGKILYEKEASTQFYPASITKLMTALLVIENLKPTDIITFSEEAIYSIEWGSSSIGMRIGEQITVDQALRGLLLMSANEIASALAEKVSGSIDNFATLMTNRAHELGALNTNFTNPHGLHDIEHYTTAYDMALITQELLTHDYFLEIMRTPVTEIPPTNKSDKSRPLSQQHLLMNEIRDSRFYMPEVTGGKTGFTDEARNTLVTTANKDGIELITVLLNSQASTYYQDTTNLLNYGFDSYHSIHLHSPSDIVETLSIYAIQSGELFETATSTISVPMQQSVLVPKDVKFREITTQVNLPPYLELGVESGSIVGQIDYISNNKIISSNDLIISNINFNPSPLSVHLPESIELIFPINFFIFLTTILTFLIIILFVIKNNYRRYRFKHKKLKFNTKIK